MKITLKIKLRINVKQECKYYRWDVHIVPFMKRDCHHQIVSIFTSIFKTLRNKRQGLRCAENPAFVKKDCA